MWLKVLAGIWTVAKETGLAGKLKGWIVRRVEKSKNKYDDKILEGAALLKKLNEE